MSDQEMHFADPDWQPTQQTQQSRRTSARPSSPPVQPVNDTFAQPSDTARAASQGEANEVGEKIGDSGGYAPYEEGYHARQWNDDSTSNAQDQDNRESQQSQQWGQWQQASRKRHGALFWTLLIVVLGLIVSLPFDFEDGFFPGLLLLGFIALAIIALTRLFGRSSSASQTETHTFTVKVQPKIIVKGNSGTFRVHSGGEPNQVVVQATKHSSGLLGNPAKAAVQYEQNNEKNRISVKSRSGWHILGNNSVDIDITVPRMADLELKTEAGSIIVSDVRGQMNLASDAGSVKATGVMLRGDSRLKTDAGTITFSGSLHSTGAYTMTTDAGSVNVTLPAEASFRVDAKTDVGSINSHFPLTVQRDFPGAKARGEVGPGPYPTLKLRTDVGSINVWQG
jgi:flagellar basal body-associated protein FliL